MSQAQECFSPAFGECREGQIPRECSLLAKFHGKTPQNVEFLPRSSL